MKMRLMQCIIRSIMMGIKHVNIVFVMCHPHKTTLPHI